jgi:hypothetical protein
LRDFDSANVSCGSKASDRRARRARGMSAAPPIAPEIVHCSDSTKSAMSRQLQCNKSQGPYLTPAPPTAPAPAPSSPRSGIREKGIGDSGDVGQQAARAGRSADRPRSCRRGPRSREAMDKEEERDTPVLYDTYIRRSAVRTTPKLLR